MKAIILAAGYGNRMRPITDDTHKTLIEVGGRTVIGRILDSLAQHGIFDVTVVLGYRAEELSAHLLANHGQGHAAGQGGPFRFTFITNERYRETNNIHSLALAFERMPVDDDVVLIESDLIYEPAIITRLLASPHANVALVDRWASGMDGTVLALNGDQVASVIPAHQQGPGFDFSDKYKTLNIYRFSREYCERDFRRILSFYSQAIDDNCYYELMLGILVYMQRGAIHALDVHGLNWAEVDDPNDLRIAEYRFNPARRRDILEGAWGGYWSYPVTDFAFIRNMHFPPGSVMSELRSNLPDLLGNYGSSQDILNQKLAYWLLRPVEHLVLLNGASQVFPLLREYFAGRRALCPQPGFGEYARVFPGAQTYVDAGGAQYASSLAAALEQGSPEVVVVVNPNNPTGSTVPTAQLCAHIAAYPGCFFIVDESFIDFSGEPSLEDAAPAGLRNFAVIKSLSKTLGVPGARLGYLYTRDTALREHVMHALPIWNTNSVAENLLEIILKHRRAFEQSVRRTVAEREEFARQLAAVPGVRRVWPSGANYLLVELAVSPEQSQAIVSRLLDDHGILVKEASAKLPGPHAFWRLAVRTPAEHQRLCAAMSERLAKA